MRKAGVGIGAPEHKLAFMGKPYRHNFDALLEDLRSICFRSAGLFKTIVNRTPFQAVVADDGSVNFIDIKNNVDIAVSADELYEA